MTDRASDSAFDVQSVRAQDAPLRSKDPWHKLKQAKRRADRARRASG